MGLFVVDCIVCHKPFHWHSSCSQICGQCNEDAGGFSEVFVSSDNHGVSYLHFVPNNKIENRRIVLIEKLTIDTDKHKAAVKFLIDGGINKNDIQKL